MKHDVTTPDTSINIKDHKEPNSFNKKQQSSSWRFIVSTVIVTMIEQTWVEALSIAEGQEKWVNVRNESVDVEVNKTEGIEKLRKRKRRQNMADVK